MCQTKIEAAAAVCKIFLLKSTGWSDSASSQYSILLLLFRDDSGGWLVAAAAAVAVVVVVDFASVLPLKLLSDASFRCFFSLLHSFLLFCSISMILCARESS